VRIGGNGRRVRVEVPRRPLRRASVAAPVLRLAAMWAARVVNAKQAVAVVRSAAGRTLVHVGCGPPLADELVDAIAAAVHEGRSCVLSHRAGAALRQVAASAGVRAAAGVPVTGRAARGCVIVAGGATARFAAADMAALGEVAASLGAALDEVDEALVAARQSLRRVLHDGAGQTLASLVYAIRQVEDEAPSPALRLRLRAIRAQAADGVREMRAILEHMAVGGGRRRVVRKGRRS
jgi:signal transduction histidine kinase